MDCKSRKSLFAFYHIFLAWTKWHVWWHSCAYDAYINLKEIYSHLVHLSWFEMHAMQSSFAILGSWSAGGTNQIGVWAGCLVAYWPLSHLAQQPSSLPALTRRTTSYQSISLETFIILATKVYYIFCIAMLFFFFSIVLISNSLKLYIHYHLW